MAAAQPTSNLENDRVVVTTWEFGDGDETGDHVHAYDYVVVPVTGGTFEVVNADGSVFVREQRAGESYVGPKGTAHNVINRSGRPATFVEIELK